MKKKQIANVNLTEAKYYVETIKNLKNAILTSRYRAAALANKEMLALYFEVGKLISERVRTERWGAKILEQISNDLQKELPGLRGFSSSNIKKMRVFFDAWESHFVSLSFISNQIGSTPSNQLSDYFFLVSFSHHYQILSKTKNLEERLFYIAKIATEFWSLTTLRHHLNSNLYRQQGTLPNNFSKTISQNDLRAKALQSFKDEYLLDFINIEDPDDEDERMIENEIVRNIKKFLLSLGNDFAFIGNQHRFVIMILSILLTCCFITENCNAL